MHSPILTLDADLTEVLVQAAILAPSSHNTQPWRFRLAGDTIELRADRTRALPVNDPHDRELTISCGCALFNLRVAAAAAGWIAHVSVPSGSADRDLLACVTLVRGTAPAALTHLAPLISERRTYRKRFVDQPIEEAVIIAVQAAVAAEGAQLCVLRSDAQRHGAASLVAEGDAMQWDDPDWRRELADWMHPRRRGDGLTMPALAVPLAQAVVRTFDMGGGVGAKDRDLADASPLLAVISTTGDIGADWLAAGQALQRALLVGLAHGLQASYLNQPVQCDELRPQLQALCADLRTAQLLVRWGVPESALSAAPRRPVADVIVS